MIINFKTDAKKSYGNCIFHDKNGVIGYISLYLVNYIKYFKERITQIFSVEYGTI